LFVRHPWRRHTGPDDRQIAIKITIPGTIDETVAFP